MSRVGIRALLLSLSFAVLGLLSTTLAAEFTGPVISVLDGDTIEVLHNIHPERVRLSGIDCPEKGQAFSYRAKQAVSALAFGKEVIFQTHGQDISRPALTRWNRCQSRTR